MHALIDPAGNVCQIAPEPFSVPAGYQWEDVGTSGAQIGWSYSAGIYNPPAVTTLPIQQQAKAALADSDTAMHRVSEGVVLGKTSWTAADVVAFVTWRVLLRAIMNETASPSPSVLPARPAYPAGT